MTRPLNDFAHEYWHRNAHNMAMTAMPYQWAEREGAGGLRRVQSYCYDHTFAASQLEPIRPHSHVHPCGRAHRHGVALRLVSPTRSFTARLSKMIPRGCLKASPWLALLALFASSVTSLSMCSNPPCIFFLHERWAPFSNRCFNWKRCQLLLKASVISTLNCEV